jgi:hypothetical protein
MNPDDLSPDDLSPGEFAHIGRYAAEFKAEVDDLLAMAVLLRATEGDRRVAGVKLVTYMVDRYCDAAPTYGVLMMATVTANVLISTVEKEPEKESD